MTAFTGLRVETMFGLLDILKLDAVDVPRREIRR
jgi:hypothetical protein